MTMPPVFRIITVTVCICSFFAGVAFAQETLTWEACLEEARRNNPDLISAVENVNEEKANRSITGAGMYPQIEGVGVASRTKREAGGTGNSTTDSYSYGITLSQLLFDGFRTANDVRASGQNVEAARQNYRFTSSEIRRTLREAFVGTLKAQELARVAEDIVKLRRDNLELIALRYHSGLEHRGAAMTAEANVAQAESERSQARRELESSQRRLTAAMGRRQFAPLVVVADFSVKDAAVEKPDFEAIVANNPSLLVAGARKNAASYGVKSAYADFLPQLTADLGGRKSDADWPPQDRAWNAGLSLNVPIFEGGLRSAEVSRAKAVFRQAEADERSVKDSVIVALQDSWAGLQDALETVNVQRKSLDAARERSKIAEAQYSTGFITFDAWIIIQDNLVTATKAFLNAQANALLAEAAWIQAKGETLEYEN